VFEELRASGRRTVLLRDRVHGCTRLAVHAYHDGPTPYHCVPPPLGKGTDADHSGLPTESANYVGKPRPQEAQAGKPACVTAPQGCRRPEYGVDPHFLPRESEWTRVGPLRARHPWDR
jgi:hypothetical protein